MTAPDYQRVKRVLTEVADLAPATREARLHELCAGDDALLAEVRALLAHVDDPSPRVAAVPGARAAIADRLDAAAPDLEPTHHLDGRLEPGARVGPFVLGERLGAGGMGVVFAAEQDAPRRTVALKFLAESASVGESQRRFRQEIHALGRLDHPGIATIYEAGAVETSAGVQPFFAMQLVRGTSLARWLDDAPDLDAVLDVMLQVCDAVAHAHDVGVVHRDLKPSNVLIEDGRAVVVDFGIAKLTDAHTQLTSMATSSGQILGTIGSMSPEQVDGDPARIGATTDVYALGVMLFAALTGRAPIDLAGLSVPAAAVAIREREPRRLLELRADVPQQLDWIVDKALAKEPERRYVDARQLGDDLRRLVARERVVAKPLSSGQQLLRLARRHRVVTGAIVVTLASLVAALVVSLESVRSERAASELARGEAARARVAAAQAASDDGEPTSAARHLDAVPAHHRGWEWYHLDDRLAPFTVLTDAVDGVPIVTEDARARRLLVASQRGGLVDLSLDGDATPLPWARDVVVHALSDAASVAVLHRDARLEVVDAATGGTRASRPADAPKWVAVDTDGTAVAWATSETLFRWDVATDTVASRALRAPREYNQAIVTADGLLVSRTFKLVERLVVDGDELVSVAKAQVSQQRLGGVAQHANGGPIAVATREGELVLLEADTLERFASFPAHRGAMTAVAVSADGTRVASAGVDHTLRLWDTSTQRLVGTWSTGEHTLRELVFTHDGRRVVAGAVRAALAFDVTRPAESDVLTGHTSYVYDVTTIDDDTAASVSWDTTLRRWDLARGEELEMTPLDVRGTLVSSSPDGERIALMAGHRVMIESADGTLEVAKASKRLRSLPWLDARHVVVGALRGGNNARAFAVIDAHTGEVVAEHLTERSCCSLGLASEGRVVVGAPGGDVSVLDLASGVSTTLGEHDAAVVSISVDRSGRRVLTTSEDGHARLWDLDERRLLHDLPHGQEVWCGLWLPDDSRIVTGCHDGVVRLFDPDDGVLVASLRGHTNYVHALDVTPDGRAIVSASGDATLRVWRAPGYVSRPDDPGR